MAEKGGPRFDIAKLRWADVAPLSVVEPADGKKDTGWAPEILPDGNLNWRWQKVHEALRSISAASREFEYLADVYDPAGVDEAGPPAIGDRFKVSGLGAGTTLYRPGDLRWSATSNSVNTIAYMCADAEHLYYAYAATDQEVHAVDPRDGSAVWTNGSPVASDVEALACDGNFVYASRSNGNLYLYDRATGAEVAVIALGAIAFGLAANGKELVAIYGTWLQAWDTLGATPSSLGTVAISGTPAAVAVDDLNVYVLANSPARVESRVIQSLAVINYTSYPPEVTSPMVVGGMAYDGQTLYISQSGGGVFGLCALNALDGAGVWATSTPVNPGALVVDSRYVWGQSALTAARGWDKTSGQEVYAAASAHPILAADGWAVYGSDGADTIQARASQVETQAYMRVSGSDPKRRYYRLATPSDDARMGPVAPLIYSFGQTETPGSTTSAFPDPSPYFTLSFAVPAGDYRIEWYFEYSVALTNQQGTAEIRVDGTTVSRVVREPKSSANRFGVGGYAHRSLTAGAHTVTVEWGVTSGSIDIYRARIDVIRMESNR